MKKRAISLMLLMLMLLTACGEETPTETPAPTATVLSKGDCFTVSEEYTDNVAKYCYTITDKSGNVLESALCSEQPRVAVINDNLLGVRFYVNDKTFCRYYDLKNSRVSKSFFNAFWDDGTLVAYHDYNNGHRMMVSDIFDEDGYSYELDLDIQALSITVTTCQQDEQTGDLTVGYTYGDSETEYTVTLPTRASE